MKKSKEVIWGFAIIALVITVLSFIDPVDNGKVSSIDLDVVTDLEREIDQLKQDIDRLEDSLFESKKFIFDSNVAKDYFPETEILYKEIEETKYVMFFRDVQGIHLNVASKEPRYESFLSVPTLDPVDGITFDYNGIGEDPFDNNGIMNHSFGGVITNNEIKDVNVSFNGEVYKANIFKVDDNMYGWYSIFKKTSAMDENTIKTQALDENGYIIWQRTLR